MKPEKIKHDGTPEEVLDAIYVIAKYLHTNNYMEAAIHKSGGAEFHVQSRNDMELTY